MTKFRVLILGVFILICAENLSAGIINNIEDPCIRELVNGSISESMTNEISTLIRNLYNVHDSINLTIDQAYDLDNPVDAVTSGYYNPFGGLNIDISLNGHTMPATSREYVMATLYHEFLHAILLYDGVKKGQPNMVKDGQVHEPIAAGYRNILIVALLQQFPDLSKNDATMLAWEGLHGTKAWNNLSESTRIDIFKTNAAYKMKLKGSGCN